MKRSPPRKAKEGTKRKAPRRRQARLLHFFDVTDTESGRILCTTTDEAEAGGYASDCENPTTIERRVAAVLDTGFGYDVLPWNADLPPLEIGQYVGGNCVSIKTLADPRTEYCRVMKLDFGDIPALGEFLPIVRYLTREEVKAEGGAA